jgi:hypothetical protein
LATGSTFQTLAFQFRVGKTTVCNVVHETCETIWKALHTQSFRKASKRNWENIAAEFENRWNFPHCIGENYPQKCYKLTLKETVAGALDGKHVRIQAPANTGSEYFNYKQFFSILLLAVCDADYKFTYVDLGSAGCESDDGVFNKSSLCNMLQCGKLDLPETKKIKNYPDCVFPYFIVADEAFPLKENIMRPYPGKSLTKSQIIFNFRLSRARRTIENAFGILLSRWRIFHGPIIAKVENVEKYIQAAVS